MVPPAGGRGDIQRMREVVEPTFRLAVLEMHFQEPGDGLL